MSCKGFRCCLSHLLLSCIHLTRSFKLVESWQLYRRVVLLRELDRLRRSVETESIDCMPYLDLSMLAVKLMILLCMPSLTTVTC